MKNDRVVETTTSEMFTTRPNRKLVFVNANKETHADTFTKKVSETEMMIFDEKAIGKVKKPKDGVVRVAQECRELSHAFLLSVNIIRPQTKRVAVGIAGLSVDDDITMR